MNICVWAVLRYHTHYHAHPGAGAEQEAAAVSEEERMAINLISDCPFFVEDAIDHFVYNLPVFILLACNVFFLVWIMIVRFSPIRSAMRLARQICGSVLELRDKTRDQS